jgi:uncharacterized membrane protein YccC
MGLYLVPVGALMAQPWQTGMFTAMTANFVPLLAPANQMSYDTVEFYNTALAIVAGCTAGALSFRLMPPLSPALRVHRLLAWTLRDLRRLATDSVRWQPDDWQDRINARLAAIPDEAEPLQRAQMVTALSVGTEILHLRRVAPRFGWGPELDVALDTFAQGNVATAVSQLTDIDHSLSALPDIGPQRSLGMRTRGRILAICDALVQHAAYFARVRPVEIVHRPTLI